VSASLLAHLIVVLGVLWYLTQAALLVALVFVGVAAVRYLGRHWGAP